MLADHPDKAKEYFVKWAEFVATHEDIHKQYNLLEAEMDFFTYYCFDILAVFLAIGFIIYQCWDLVKSLAGSHKHEEVSHKIKSQ